MITQDKKNRRVLVVDDNHSIHSDFRKILEPKKADDGLDDLEADLFEDEKKDETTRVAFELDSAFQGQEALERVKAAVESKNRYAMAFVDMRMPPGWNGVRSIEEIWKIDPELQIVICTAFSDYSWNQIAERLGLTDRLLILKKPFDKIEVTQLALALTEKSHLFEQAAVKLEQLEEMVASKTAKLQQEIVERQNVEEELRKAKNELQHQATHDDTTEIWNRRALDGILEQSLANHGSSPVSVLFIDIDHFKSVNDTYGHAVGDSVLTAVSERLRGQLRTKDEVGRYGGEEFLVVLRDCPAEAARDIANRLRACIADTPIECGDVSLSITASFGVATTQPNEEKMKNVVERADQAMYTAKKRGRNRVEWANETDVAIETNLVSKQTLKQSC